MNLWLLKIVCVLIILPKMADSLAIYPDPNNEKFVERSRQFKIEFKSSREGSSWSEPFVYVSRSENRFNDSATAFLPKRTVSWTSFSFDSDEVVQVKVSVIGERNFDSCLIRPTRLAINCRVLERGTCEQAKSYVSSRGSNYAGLLRRIGGIRTRFSGDPDFRGVR